MHWQEIAWDLWPRSKDLIDRHTFVDLSDLARWRLGPKHGLISTFSLKTFRDLSQKDYKLKNASGISSNCFFKETIITATKMLLLKYRIHLYSQWNSEITKKIIFDILRIYYWILGYYHVLLRVTIKKNQHFLKNDHTIYDASHLDFAIKVRRSLCLMWQFKLFCVPSRS